MISLGINVTPETKRLLKIFAGLFLLIAGLYWGWGYYRIGLSSNEKEKHIVIPRVNKGYIAEVGYIYDLRITNDLWEGEKYIFWWVKIPTTNEIWACYWQNGFTRFNKNDSVILIHNTGEDQDVEWTGYIVGMHNQKKDKVAEVWAIDIDIFSPY